MSVAADALHVSGVILFAEMREAGGPDLMRSTSGEMTSRRQQDEELITARLYIQ